MNGNIVGEEFEPYVFSEITFRQSIQGKQSRNNTELNYLSNQSSWVKLASPVFIEEGGKARLNSILANITDVEKYQGMELAKNAVLFNGLSSLQEKTYTQRAGIVKNNTKLWDTKAAYGLGGSDFGLQPMPGIIDAEVRCLNRGSIKKASINIKAFNKFQFEIIELLYLRLGYTMMLEFGNQKYPDQGKISEVGNTFIEEIYFNKNSNGLTQLEALEKIEELRDKYNGNYDGFFGKVVNFDWNFEEDGSYSIRIDLITLGDVIESLQANPPIKAYFPESLDTKAKTELIKENESLKDSPILNNASNDVLSAFMYDSLFKEDLWKKSRGGENDRYANYFNLSKEADQVASNEKTNYPDKIPAKYSYYITFEELLKQVKKYLIPNVIAKNKKIEEQLSIDNSPSTYVNYFPNQISFDPRVCLIKPSLGGANIGKIKTPDIFEDLKNYVGVIEENVVVGQLMHVYLNYDFISQCLSTSRNDEKISIYTFLKKICDGISTALGGVNQIEVIIDESKNIIKFIDQTPIPGLAETKKRTDIVDLEVFGYNNVNQTSNFVKGINFNTKITPELASMITIGATAKGSNVKNEDATAFSKWNVGLTDRFNEEIIEPETKINPFNPEDDPKRWEEEATNIWENEAKPVLRKTTYRKGTIFKEVETTATVNNYTEGKNYQVVITNKKEIPSEKSAGGGKRFTKEDYINYYRTYKEKELKENNAIEEFKFQNELTKNYTFYLSDCFGGDVKYNVLLDEKEKDIVVDEEADFVSKIFIGAYNKYLAPTISTKTIGGSGKVKYLTFDPSFISRSNGIYKNYLNVFFHSKFNTFSENQQPTQPSPQIGFIPVSFDINLQGISGIKIYNKLNINQRFLPAQYPEALKFLITRVDHKISDNNWNTNLSTLSIPNIDPDDYRQIWRDIGVDINDLGSVLLPENQRGPKAKGNKFTIEDHRAPKYRGNPTLGEEKTRIAQTGRVFSEISLEKLISQFHPQFRSRFASFFTEMDEKYKGYTIKINSIQRDLKTSQDLKKENPNNADPGYSRHNYNTAVDFNVITSDGKELKKSVNRNDWINHGFDKLAAKHNIDWGGNFDTYNDYVHFAVTDYDVSKGVTEFNSGKDVNSINLV
jgi:hypothetical protein